MPSPNKRFSRYYTYIDPVIKHPVIRSYGPQVFTLITLLIFILFAIRPTVSTILSLQQNTTNQQTVLESLKNKSTQLTAARQNIENLDPSVRQKINTKLPLQANITTVISGLRSSLGNEASISALQIQPVTIIKTATTNTPKSSYLIKEVDFSFVVSGSYLQLLSALDKISSSPRLISITSVNMSRTNNNEPVTMSIEGTAYFLE